MLDFIRKNAGSWMVKFILGAIVVVFVFWGIGSFRSSRMDVVAKVNGEKILFETFRDVYAHTLDRYRQMFGGTIPDFIKTEDIKKQVIQDLIDKVLIRQKADELGIMVSDQEVQAAILRVPAFQKDGVFNQEIYQRTLQRARLTPASFESQVKEELLLNRVRSLLAAGLDVPENEIRDRYSFMNQEIDLSYVVIDPNMCKSSVKITDKDLESWYEKHKEEYRTEPQERIRYLLFKRSDVIKGIKVTQDEIKDYYQSHKDQFTLKEKRRARHILLRVPPQASEQEVEKVKKKAEDLYERIKKGEDFAKLAKKYSEDKGTAQKGGDLGFFTKGTMVKPFDQEVFSMKEGQVSSPVRTQFGWHIIKLEKIQPARVKPLKEVKATIESRVKTQKATKILWERANQAYDEIIDLGGLEAYAKAHNMKLEATGLFTEKNPPSVLGINPEVLSGLFSLGKGELSSLLEVPQGVLIAEVLEKKAPYVPELEEVKDRVKKDVKREKARQLCRQKAEDLLKLAKKKGLKEAAKQMKLDVKDTGFFKRMDRSAGGKLPAQVVEEAKGLYEQKRLPDEVLEASRRFYVVSFNKSKPADLSGLEKLKDQLRNQLLMMKQQTVFKDWLDHLRAQANIEINESF